MFVAELHRWGLPKLSAEYDFFGPGSRFFPRHIFEISEKGPDTLSDFERETGFEPATLSLGS